MGKHWRVRYFIFLGSKITADADCTHEIKRRLLLGRKVMTSLDSILWSRGIICQQRSISVQFSSVTPSYLTLCNPMDCSTPGSPSSTNSQSLLKLMSLQSVMPSNHLILWRSLLLRPSIFPTIRVFLMSQFFASRNQIIGASASASVLPMNIQTWFPLGLIALISFPSKGISRVFYNTTIQKPQFFSAQLFFMVQLSYPYMTAGKTIALIR